MIKLKYLTIVSAIFIFTGCINKDSIKESGAKTEAISTWELSRKRNQRLIGNRIEKSICPCVLDIEQAHCVLLLSINDCSSCVDRSLELLCRIGKVLDNRISIVSMDTIEYDIPCLTNQVIDTHEKLKKAINPFLTPSIVVMHECYIIDIISISSEFDDNEKYINESSEFINGILGLGL